MILRLAFLFLLFASRSVAEQIVVDFENHKADSNYAEEDLKSDWKDIGWARTERARIVGKEKRALEVSYPAGGYRSAGSGAQFLAKFKPTEEASFSYRFRFGEKDGSAWEFSKGGKLPGLAGGTYNSGGKKPTGDGWSSRFMWREKGRLFVYLYHVDQKENYGDYIDLKYQAEAGEWISIRQQIILNQGDERDGLLRVWINGKLHLQRDDLRFRLGTKAPISAVLFDTFYGGSTKSWAPKTDTLAFFDDLQVSIPARDLVPRSDAKPSPHPLKNVDNANLVPFIVGDPADLPGLVLDEHDAKLVGEWAYSTHTPPYVGVGYLHDQKEGKGKKSAAFHPTIPADGRYEVRLAHCSNPRRATNVPITVIHAEGKKSQLVDMQKPGEHGKLWKSLGVFEFKAGTQGGVLIETADTDTTKVVIVDAVQFLKVE